MLWCSRGRDVIFPGSYRHGSPVAVAAALGRTHPKLIRKSLLSGLERLGQRATGTTSASLSPNIAMTRGQRKWKRRRSKSTSEPGLADGRIHHLPERHLQQSIQ